MSVLDYVLQSACMSYLLVALAAQFAITEESEKQSQHLCWPLYAVQQWVHLEHCERFHAG